MTDLELWQDMAVDIAGMAGAMQRLAKSKGATEAEILLHKQVCKDKEFYQVSREKVYIAFEAYKKFRLEKASESN